jgi:hypothetical protein
MLATVILNLVLAQAAGVSVLGDSAGALLAAYWISLIVGAGMLILSALGGSGHSDVDVQGATGVDFHADADVSVDSSVAGADFHAEIGHPDAVHATHAHEAAALSTWFSVRFAVFFLAMFGAVGVILTYFAALPTSLTCGLALAGGAIVGQGAHQIMRLIQRTSGNSTPQPVDYVNKLARVTIPVKHPDQGEVVLQVRGTERYIPAIAAGNVKDFDTGDEVVVVTYRAGVAQVISRAEFERAR